MFKNSKNVKRFVSISAAAVCLLSSLRIAPISFVADAADKTMTAFEITENMKVGWNLGNTLDAYAQEPNPNNPKQYIPVKSAGLETETCWGCPKANQTLFNAIKAKGFNTVRIPTTWFQHLDENDNIDPAWMARVHEVVDYAYKNGMYVILNVHHEEDWINRPDLATAYDEINPRLMKIWTQIATEFKDYDQHLIFECMNEPRAKGTSWEWWSATPVKEADVINKLEANFVKLIRGMDGPYAKTRLLMLPGYVASSDKTFLNQIVLPENDDFLAVSIHAYTPYNFTMNTDESTGAYHDTFTKEFSNDLAYNLQNFRDMFVNKGVPVVIGEMGTSNFGNTQARVEWTTQYFTTTKKYGIPCCLWDNNIEKNPDAPGECHGYINRETGEWYQSSLPVINKMMEIINDKSIVWGSEGKMPTFDHKDLSTGKVFLENAEIDVAREKEYGNSTPGKEISWNDLKGKEVAIKYTGDVPVLAVSDKDYKGWTEMAAYTVDEDNKIAYYLVDQQVPAAWSGDLANINHMQARTPGKTTIEKMVILDAPDAKIDVPVDKTKKTNIDFANAQAGDNLIIKIKGEPNTDTNGCVGFNGDGWEQIEWEGKTDANGALTVEIPMSKFPTGIQSAEAQIWYQAELVDFDGYNFGKAQAETTTTTATTTTTTTTTSTTTTSDTTTTTTVTSSASTTEPIVSTTTTTTPVPKKGGNGDANQDGQVDMADVVLIMQSMANPNKFKLSDKGAEAADVYENNGVTTQDALAIQYFLLHQFTELPVPAGVVIK
ncbi:cellulase family glycosylhydrolase [Ruminococcus flavefaciens]|uniref:cellulase family glycosylhydrolase n=1 Tax=Ruminococcus flavefaciens TaxID=1265 RepID=UPI0026EB2B3F|nr:cellulase family glycosylhydrolase [Ruminococcus flavefaciens]